MSVVVKDQHGRPLPLVRLIGKGGQAEVWASEGRIAVKLMHARGPRSAARVRSRIGVVRRLNLDGVPISRPLDLLEQPDVGYSMELLDGMMPVKRLAVPPADADVFDWYAATGGQTRRLRVLAKTAGALAELHTRGLVYSDPSPDNVLVSEDGRHTEVRLVDVDFLQSESVVLESAATPGYAAPEVFTQRSGVTGTSDAFAFAVIAFEVLTLTHPFLGDQVHHGEVEMLDRAYSGELPWIDDEDDPSNRSRYGLSRDAILLGKLSDCARSAFTTGVRQPRRRPSAGEWRTALHAAADMLLACAACGRDMDARLPSCPWCWTAAPHPLVAVVYEAAADGKLHPAREALAVPAGSWWALTARTMTGDTGEIDSAAVTGTGTARIADPGMALLGWLWWEPGVRLIVRNDGTIPLWLRPEDDPVAVAVVEPGRELAVPVQGTTPRWTLHFGPPGQPHRVLRFTRLNTTRTGGAAT
jgi:eukaryotic-like serine/threonine-protein kinase